MKNVILIVFIFIGTICYSQNIKQLETELRYWKSGEEYGDKIKLARSLQKIDPFNEIAINYICDYYHDRQIDSVNIFFENLATKFPNQPEPFLLRSEFLHSQSGVENYTSKKVEYLLKAKEIDPSNFFANYWLSETYYQDFILPFKKPKYDLFSEVENDSIFDTKIDSLKKIKPKSFFPNSAELALQSFKNLWDISDVHKNVIYYPMKQLACFLNVELPTKYMFEKNTNQYFPTNQFMNLTTDWECDITIDYLFEAEKSQATGSWLTDQLINLDEPKLYSMNSNINAIIYRFTWLRSFDHPISVRIEKIDEKYNLYWAIGKGSGGYEPKGLKSKGKRKITSNEWQTFESLLNKTNYKNLPNEEYVLMTDGATWTLEHSESDIFDAKNTNSPNKEFESLCLYLIKLAKIKIKTERIY
ncbi:MULTISPECIES: hypothetical protein [Flavobacterium]|uniref:hypothetical protein n=1 Tax=Flavobacterium TaxID=237 RepID=UPI001FCA6B17|nr:MULTISPECIES: hypothetical protein [Flavobacterium]UOK41622.1 hypothetical protein LZF87_09895 [Flavobacterium enshiense]